ncbi:MAG: SusC/RagA family TonB-linked outer membrane protein [Chitinophagaceae bacterium]
MNYISLRTLILPALIVFFATTAFAQNKTVSGRVTDAGGAGLPGVSVSARGTNTGTSTDATGNYTITVPTAITTLVFSSVGYGTQEVNIGGQTNVDVRLQAAAGNLSEVVVIGYGTARRRDLTGSVANVTSKDFVKGPITTPEQLIAGKVAGVQITSNDGMPGSGSRIRIRGGTSLNASNDPLIVIDGVPIDNASIAGAASPLSMINPNDIESMSVLKDASAAAIYGNRAANGVILITTKKGSTGKLRVNFSSLNSVSRVTDIVDVLSADEFRTFVNERGSASDKTMLGNANTNWQEEIYRSAFSTDNNISLSGGLPNVPYRLNLGYLNQNGILKRSNLQRTSVGLNLSPKFLNNHLGIDANGKYSYQTNFFGNQGAIGSAVYFDPTKPIYSGKDNQFGGYSEWLSNDTTLNGLAPKNPLGLLDLRNDESNVNRFIGNIQFDYKMHFLPDLRANINLGTDRSHGEGTVFVPGFAAADFTRGSAGRNGGRFNQYEEERTNKLFESYLNYAKDIAAIGSRIDAIAGYSWQDWKYESPSFPDLAADRIDTIKQAGVAGFAQNTLVSFYGRLNYSYKSRYLATVTFRRDGSSRFSEQNRWGNFPSAALAWNIKQEPFLKNNDFLTALKLRFGWGITGQQEGIGNFGFLPFYSYGDLGAQYQFGNTFYPVVRPQGYDVNLRWEETEARNVGIDIGFLDNRINFTADYYNKDTRDLLAVVPAPAGTNFTNQLLTNVGSLKNQGLEFTLTTNPVRRRDFNLDLGFNLTYIIQNEITNLQLVNDPTYLGAEVGSIGLNGYVQRLTVGYRPYTYFLYKQVYDKDDKPIEGLYEDKNRDGKIDDLDKYWMKNPEPTVFMGFSANATINKLGAGFTMRANYGNYMFNNLNVGAGIFENVSSGQNYLNNATNEILVSGFNRRQSWSDYYLENASFLRMDNAYLNYNVGRIANDRANLRLSLNVQNVFVVTKYSGLDPEVIGGIDGSIYPRPRMYALGINLDF